MKNAIRKIMAFSCSAVLLLCNSLTAFAEVALPDGAVKGLPKKLSVLDSDGNSVSENGEYFFIVENMKPFVSYTKKIQIMNLREDKAYHIYFYAEPVSQKGGINLEQECETVFTLDGNEIFRGKVTGEPAEGYSDISEAPLDLGLYEPGKSRNLTASITWNGQGAGDFIDYGEKIVDKNGTHIIREESGEHYIYGETEFRWIFYAVVDDEYIPPKTGVLAVGNIFYAIAVAVIVIMIAVLCILICLKKRKDKK